MRRATMFCWPLLVPFFALSDARAQGAANPSAPVGQVVTEVLEVYKNTFDYEDRNLALELAEKYGRMFCKEKSAFYLTSYLVERNAELIRCEFAGTDVKIHPENLFSRYEGFAYGTVTYIINPDPTKPQKQSLDKEVGSIRDLAFQHLLKEAATNEDLLAQLARKTAALATAYRTAGVIAGADLIGQRAAQFSDTVDRVRSLQGQLERQQGAAFQVAADLFRDTSWIGGDVPVHNRFIGGTEVWRDTQSLRDELRDLADQIARNSRDAQHTASHYATLEQLGEFETHLGTGQIAAKALGVSPDAVTVAKPTTKAAPWSDVAAANRAALARLPDPAATTKMPSATALAAPPLQSPAETVTLVQPPVSSSAPLRPSPFEPGQEVSLQLNTKATQDIDFGGPIPEELAQMQAILAQIEAEERPYFATIYQKSDVAIAWHQQCLADFRAEVRSRFRSPEQLNRSCHTSGMEYYAPRKPPRSGAADCTSGCQLKLLTFRDPSPPPADVMRGWMSEFRQRCPEAWDQATTLPEFVKKPLRSSDYYDPDTNSSIVFHLGSGWPEPRFAPSPEQERSRCGKEPGLENQMFAETVKISSGGSSVEALTSLLIRFSRSRGYDEAEVFVSASPVLPRLSDGQTWARGGRSIDLRSGPVELWPPKRLLEARGQLETAR